MLFDKNKTILAALLTTFAFASAPALADDDWDDDDDDDRRARPTRVYQKHNHNHKTAAYKISHAQAKSIAQKRYPSARVTDVDLERKRNGGAYYQVDLEDRRYDYEVWVDANTGSIIHHKRERDNND